MMKIMTVGLASLMILFSQWASAENPKGENTGCENRLAGAWELHYAVYKNDKGDVVGEIKDNTTLSRKILSNQYFTFVTWDKSGKFIATGSGTYTLKGEAYTEIVDATSEARLMGKTYAFNCTFKNGLWIHKGMEDGILIEEHWRRIAE